LIEQNDHKKVFTHMLNQTDHRPKADVHREFHCVQRVLGRAQDCTRREKCEAAWNEEVHRAIFDLAFEDCGNISTDNVTSAKIAPDFVPQLSTPLNTKMQSKMVDYTVNLILDEADVNVLRASFADAPLPSHRTINQSLYAAIRERPSAVSIETKIDDPNDPIAQLAIWVSAWHSRMRLIVPKEVPIVTLPLIIITKDGWKLCFFCDCGTRAVSHLVKMFISLDVLLMVSHRKSATTPNLSATQTTPAVCTNSVLRSMRLVTGFTASMLPGFRNMSLALSGDCMRLIDLDIEFGMGDNWGGHWTGGTLLVLEDECDAECCRRCWNSPCQFVQEYNAGGGSSGGGDLRTTPPAKGGSHCDGTKPGGFVRIDTQSASISVRRRRRA
jgi:hypothetical protein